MRKEILAGIIRNCLDIKKDETVNFCFQASRIKEATEMLEVLKKFSENINTIKIKHQASKFMRDKMLDSDLTIIMADEKSTVLLGHSEARSAACSKGRRVAFVLDNTNYFPSLIDLELITKREEILSSVLLKTKRIEVKTENSSFRVSTRTREKVRRPIKISSKIHNGGSWGAIPDYAEVAIAPIEISAEGEFVADVGTTGIVCSREKIVAYFSKGKIKEVEGRIADKLLKLIMRNRGLGVLCEVGFGMSHLESSSGWVFSEKKKLGFVHLGIGNNIQLGGQNYSKYHIDLVSSKADVYLDGSRLVLEEL